MTFDVNSPFNFNNPATRSLFLASSSAFNIVENTPGTLAAPMSSGGVSTFIQFKGEVTVNNGQTFTVAHDDGLTLTIGGVNLGFNPGPTAPTTSTATYTGPSGTFPFELDYGECCAGSAVLEVGLPFVNVEPPTVPPSTGVPDGGTTAVTLGLSLLGLMSLSWRAQRA